MDIFREEPEKNWAQGLAEAVKPVADAYLQQNLQLASQMKAQQLMMQLQESMKQRQDEKDYQAMVAAGADPMQARRYANSRYGEIAFKDILKRPQIERYNQALQEYMNQYANRNQTPENMQTQPIGQGSPIAEPSTGIIQQPAQQTSLNKVLGQPTSDNISNFGSSKRLNPPNVQGLDPKQSETLMKQYIDNVQHEDIVREQQLRRLQREGQHVDKMTLAIDKQESPYWNELLTEYNQGHANILKYKALEDLIETGNLSDPDWVSAVNFLTQHSIGKAINANVLLTPEDENYNKVLKEFMTGISKTFGGKVSNMELQQYMQKFPTLLNTPEGRTRIVRDLLDFAQIPLDKYKIADRIRANNNYFLPKGFSSMVEKEFEPYWKLYESKMRKTHLGTWELPDLNDPVVQKEYTEGDKIYDTKNRKSYVVKNGEWFPLKQQRNSNARR
jgi:hypothetical protein